MPRARKATPTPPEAAPPAASDERPYEELLAALEASVARLESGGLSLDEAMTTYAQGVDLAARCQTLLDRAEQQIQRLREAVAESGGRPSEDADGDEQDEDG